MKQTVYMGVDDTDVLGGPAGTGRVARGIAEHLENLGMGRTIGVIRFQLLLDPRIHYTSHNSAKCVEFEAKSPIQDLHYAGIRYLKENFQEGSDPGLCTCAAGQVPQEIVEHGKMAQEEFINKGQATKLASETGILLSEIGGSGEGIIGALAAVGLRASGNEGRYVQLRGIKDIKGLVTVKKLLQATDIAAVIDEIGKPVDSEEIIDSQDWIKPNVIGGRPILRIRLKDSENGHRIWETVEQKHKKQTA